MTEKKGEFDAWLCVDFCLKEGKLHDICFYTNLRDERTVVEFLAVFLDPQRGLDKDERIPSENDLYEVDVGLRSEDDTFGWTHNCGNAGLARGMLLALMDILVEKHKRKRGVIIPGKAY